MIYLSFQTQIISNIFARATKTLRHEQVNNMEWGRFATLTIMIAFSRYVDMIDVLRQHRFCDATTCLRGMACDVIPADSLVC